MALKTLSNASNILSFAISTAPVSDWKYYDTVYTERYMSTPQLNPVGYA
jgi:dipeptidyl aminopeptidase/acylaminoacyl peptidase